MGLQKLCFLKKFTWNSSLWNSSSFWYITYCLLPMFQTLVIPFSLSFYTWPWQKKERKKRNPQPQLLTVWERNPQPQLLIMWAQSHSHNCWLCEIPHDPDKRKKEKRETHNHNCWLSERETHNHCVSAIT